MASSCPRWDWACWRPPGCNLMAWRSFRIADHTTRTRRSDPNKFPPRVHWAVRNTMPYNHRMAQKAFVLFLFVTGLLAPATAAAADVVDFTIVGRVQFSVPANWPVIANKSTDEKTVFAFQIPNAADKCTSDSSNLSIIATDLRTAQDRDAFQKQASSTEHNAQEKKLVDGWGCSTFSAIQHSTQTQYVIWDCRRVIADCGISVRIAWPHLPKNPPDYDKQMETVLADFLTSVGPFKGVPKSGVVRRQVN